MKPVVAHGAAERAFELFDAAAATDAISTNGYIDVLDREAPRVDTVAQRLMRTRGYAWIYQAGRPIGRRLAGSPRLGRDADRRLIASLAKLRPGMTVLDIGCGPGNFTGWFGRYLGADGLAIGVDASEPMLLRAVADNSGESVVYVRGDACGLPFRSATTDAVCCLAALYLINDPRTAVEEFVRVLRPGGRLVILTSVSPSIPGVGAAIARFGGVTVFGKDEITGWLDDLGLVDVEQTVEGLAQTIAATKPRDLTAPDRGTSGGTA